MALSALGKAAGADKKLLKKLGERFGSPALGESHDELVVSATGGADILLGSSPPTLAAAGGESASDRLSLPLSTINMGSFSLKLLYYLISTMNLIFPDYDFSDLKPEAFTGHSQLTTVISAVNTTLFNAGVSKNAVTFGDFSRALWERIDGAIGLADSEIYSYSVATDEEEESPFWEQGCM